MSVTYGGSQTFTISPNSGYYITGVFADSVSHGAITSYTFTNVTSSHTISATFATNPVITASAGANGTISPNGTVSVTYGGSQTFTISPNSGYNITSVLVDGSSVGSNSTYIFTNVQASHSIAASFALIPTYTSISPTAGPTAGGTPVTITGAGFTGATAVTFGGSSASFMVNNDTSINATTPAGSAGLANFVVTAPGGSATGTYTYVATPTFGGISPATGPSSGITSVTISGTNFVTGATTVTIDGTAATNISVSSSTSLTATTPASTPAGSAGLANVVVTTAGGNSPGGTGAYDYYVIQTFTVSTPSTVPTGATSVQYCVIGGGAGGGYYGGGGGAGGFRIGNITGGLSASYPITVGTGGAGGTNTGTGQGGSGIASVFSTISAAGGGGGGSARGGGTANGVSGGSGGGAIETSGYYRSGQYTIYNSKSRK